MNSSEFKARLVERAEKAGASLSRDAQGQIEAYFRLLTRWNAKINLTALPLAPPTDQAFDRLFVEPLVASRYISDSALSWFDLGSGGGSPAIPLKIVRPTPNLTMVEVRARKAAFLRETVRTLELLGTTVIGEAFETAALKIDPGSVDLFTIRALRTDGAVALAIERLLAPGGRVFLFHGGASGPEISYGCKVIDTIELRTAGSPVLTILGRVS